MEMSVFSFQLCALALNASKQLLYLFLWCILGLAGSSGNGQKELMEALTGQRKILSGEISISGQAFHATRVQAKLFIALN